MRLASPVINFVSWLSLASLTLSTLPSVSAQPGDILIIDSNSFVEGRALLNGADFVTKKKKCKDIGKGKIRVVRSNKTKKRCLKKCQKMERCAAFQYSEDNDGKKECKVFTHQTVEYKPNRSDDITIYCGVKVMPTTSSPTTAPPTTSPPTTAPPTTSPPTTVPPTTSPPTTSPPTTIPPTTTPPTTSPPTTAPPTTYPPTTAPPTTSPPTTSPPTTTPPTTAPPTTAPPTTAPPNGASPNASWMSGKHGVGYRVPGGTHYATKNFDASELTKQIVDLPITYFIFGLSSGAAGDRYLAPHPIFKELGMRAVTPKDVDTNYYNPFDDNTNESQSVDLDSLPDIDVFDDFLTKMDEINVKVIAYLNVEGPAKLKHGEGSAFDYPGNTVGFNTGGYFVNNSVAVCQELDGVDECSPSTRKWVKWVAQKYSIPYDFTEVYIENSPLNAALKHAYANIIVDYYAERYGDRIAGFWFDAGTYGNRAEIIAAIRRHNPHAAIAYNGAGAKIPLQNNNGKDEDFTSGHMMPINAGLNPPDGCYNYGMVLSAESSHNGYVYEDVSPSENLGSTTLTPNPYIDPNFEITYNSDFNPSLAHVYLPAQELWNNGDLIWNDIQASEWMHRITSNKGAFTWAIRRTGCAGCDLSGNQATINPPDLEFLKRVYSLLPVNDAYQFNATNCDCLSALGTSDALSWGCKYNPPEDDCKNDDDWRFILAGRSKSCAFVCKGAHIRCRPDYIGDGGFNAIQKCPYCCKDSCPGYPN